MNEAITTVNGAIAIAAIIISVGSLLVNVAFSLWMELRRKKRATDRRGKGS